MLTEALSTRNLDYLQRSDFQPTPIPASAHVTSAPAELRRLVRVAGIGRFEKVPPTPGPQPTRLPTEDALSGLYGYRIPVAIQLACGTSGVSLHLGVWSPAERERANASVLDARLDILRSVLDGLYPAIDFASPVDLAPAEPLSGLALGIPSIKPPDPLDPALPLDRLIRALAGLTWSILVLAEAVPENIILDLRHRLVNEMRTAQGAAQAMQVPSPLAEHYTELLRVTLQDLTQAPAVGAWRTAVYLCGDPAAYYRLASVWRSVFSGTQSLPEPVRVWDLADVGHLAKDWALPDTPGDRGPGAYQHPFAYQTLLTSVQLAAYIHLPQQETHGYRVRLVPNFDPVPPLVAAPAISLGRVVHRNRDTQAQYVIQPKTLTRHSLVAGITGSGKTNTIFHLLKSRPARLPFLVLEPAKAEYRALLDAEELRGQLLIFTLGDERGSPFRMNPFEVVGWPESSVAVHLDLLRTAFSAGFGMWTPLPQVLEQCLHAIYLDRGWDMATNNNPRLEGSSNVTQAWPTLSDLAAKIEEIVSRLGYEERVTADFRAALLTRVNSLRTGGKGRMLDVERSLPMDVLLGHPVVLELEDVGNDDDKAFLMALLLIRIVEQRRSEGPTFAHQHLPVIEPHVDVDNEDIHRFDDLRHLLVIEEAHRLLANPGPRASEEQADPRGQAVETFTNLLAEIRAYGQGVIIVDQVPVKLAPEVMKNTSLKIAHQMVAMDDRAALAGAMAMTERQAEALAVLEPGLAAVFGEGDDAPVLVRIPQVKGLPDDSHPDRVRVAEEMSRTPALAPCRALFTPLGGALELHTPAARSAVDIARRLSQEPAVQADFVRLVLSMLEDDTALDRLWPQVQTHAHAIHKRGDDLPALLRCLAVYLSTWLAQRRGAQAQWTYAETARYDAALRALLLAQLAGQDTGPALVTYRELAVRLHARTFSPFPWCEQICPHQPSASLYRYAVADQFTSADLVRAWQQALEQDGGLAGPQAWQVCQDVAQQLLEWVPTQNAALRSVGLCFAQQMLSANSSLLPETRSAALAQLFVLAETPVVADGK